MIIFQKCNPKPNLVNSNLFVLLLILGPFPFQVRRLKFQPVSCLHCIAVFKVGIIYRWAYPKVYEFRRLIFIASASE